MTVAGMEVLPTTSMFNCHSRVGKCSCTTGLAASRSNRQKEKAVSAAAADSHTLWTTTDTQKKQQQQSVSVERKPPYNKADENRVHSLLYFLSRDSLTSNCDWSFPSLFSLIFKNQQNTCIAVNFCFSLLSDFFKDSCKKNGTLCIFWNDSTKDWKKEHMM